MQFCGSFQLYVGFVYFICVRLMLNKNETQTLVTATLQQHVHRSSHKLQKNQISATKYPQSRCHNASRLNIIDVLMAVIFDSITYVL